MGKKEREKGKRGEREAAALLRDFWSVEAYRGRQFQGGDDSPDVKTSIEGVSFEVKRTEALSLYAAMRQAQDDAALDEVPVVLHRRNNEEWLLVVEAKLFPLLVACYLKSLGLDKDMKFDGKFF